MGIVNLINYWKKRGNDQFYWEGIYRTSAGRLDIQERRGITCFYGCYEAFGASGGWHSAWLLLQCRTCEKRWYCSSERQQGLCAPCKWRNPVQADFEPRILKFVWKIPFSACNLGVYVEGRLGKDCEAVRREILVEME